MSAPLPTGPYSTPSSPVPAKGPQPYRFTPWSILRGPGKFPGEVPETLANWPTSTLEARAMAAVEAVGYSIVGQQSLDLARLRGPTKPGRGPMGILVGERNLSLDLGAQKSQLARILISAAITAVGLGLTALFLAGKAGADGVLGPVLGGLGLGSLLGSFTGRGAFDSEVVYVIFRPTVPTAPGVALNPSTPLTFEVRVGAARILSKNWSGKFGSGRSFRKIVPGGTAGASVPADVLARIRG